MSRDLTKPPYTSFCRPLSEDDKVTILDVANRERAKRVQEEAISPDAVVERIMRAVSKEICKRDGIGWLDCEAEVQVDITDSLKLVIRLALAPEE